MAINVGGVATDVIGSAAIGSASSLLSGTDFPYTRAVTYDMNAPSEDWHYRVILPKLIPGNKTKASLNWESKVDAETDDMGIYVEGIDIPSIGITSNPRKYCGRDINYPGRVNVDSFNVRFYEDRKYLTTNYLTMWRQLVVNDAGDYGLPVDYKKVIKCYAYDSFGFKHILFKMHGCYPEKASGYSYAGSNNGRIIVNCSFSCDWVAIERQNTYL